MAASDLVQFWVAPGGTYKILLFEDQTYELVCGRVVVGEIRGMSTEDTWATVHSRFPACDWIRFDGPANK